MRFSHIVSLIILIVVSCSTSALIAQHIGHTTVTFNDGSRGNRQIPTEVYYPATAAGNNTAISPGVFPVIVCGHGFVMTWSAYENIWSTLVPEGYILAFPTTESGFSPVHSDFGIDLKFLVSAILGSGAGPFVPAASVGSTSAIMGHSMGGGASFLAASNNPDITTMVSFAAANTNPSSIAAAPQVTVPTLMFSGSNDCVTPPSQHQDIMYDSTAAAYKTQIYIKGGGHCYFADYNFNCSVGESTCSPSPTITRAEQQGITAAFLKSWLAYFLKGDCDKSREFQDSLTSSPRIDYRQSQSIACPTAIAEDLSTEELISLFPNPSYGTFTVRSKSETITTVEIFSLDGKKLRHHRFNSASDEVVIDISSLAQGPYLLRVNGSKFRLVLSR